MDVSLRQVQSLTVAGEAAVQHAASTDWRKALPVLTGGGISLRELRLSDAASLCALLTTKEVARFISPPPATVEAFERFIAWTHRERAAGRFVCLALVPDGMDTAVGLFQIRQLDPEFSVAEWGFAIGQQYWGTGLFVPAATLTIEFAFETLGVHRLEARAAIRNGRGNGALAKLGAVKEGTLRRSFRRHGHYHDQALWSIVRTDWWRAKTVWGVKVH